VDNEEKNYNDGGGKDDDNDLKLNKACKLQNQPLSNIQLQSIGWHLINLKN